MDRCDEVDGCEYSPVLGRCALPDLAVPEVEGPRDATPGQTVSVDASVEDLDPDSVGTTQVAVVIYLSEDEDISPADSVVGGCTIPELAGGGLESCSAEVSIPLDLAADSLVTTSSPISRYWGACVDPDGEIDESNDANNCAAGNEVLVPEPGTGVLSLAAMGALLLLSRKRACVAGAVSHREWIRQQLVL